MKRRDALIGGGATIAGLLGLGAIDNKFNHGDAVESLNPFDEETRNEHINEVMEDATNSIDLSDYQEDGETTEVIGNTNFKLQHSGDTVTPETTLFSFTDTEVGLNAYDTSLENQWRANEFASDYGEEFADVTGDIISAVSDHFAELIDTPEDLNELDSVALRYNAREGEGSNYQLRGGFDAEELLEMDGQTYTADDFVEDFALSNGDQTKRQAYEG